MEHLNIGDKVKVIGGKHFKKKQGIQWGFVKTVTKTFAKIELRVYTQSKEKGDEEDIFETKEIGCSVKFLEKVKEVSFEMPTQEDLKAVQVLPENVPDPDTGELNPNMIYEDDNVNMVITESEEFSKDGLKKGIEEEDEELWCGDDDEPMTFQDLDRENNSNKLRITDLQKEISMLNDNLADAIGKYKRLENKEGSKEGNKDVADSELLKENNMLKELLKMYL